MFYKSWDQELCDWGIVGLFGVSPMPDPSLEGTVINVIVNIIRAEKKDLINEPWGTPALLKLKLVLNL